MENTFDALALDFLGDIVLEHDLYDNDTELNMDLKDVNYEISGVHWSLQLKEFLLQHGHEVRFTFADNNWCSVIKTN